MYVPHRYASLGDHDDDDDDDDDVRPLLKQVPRRCRLSSLMMTTKTSSNQFSNNQ